MKKFLNTVWGSYIKILLVTAMSAALVKAQSGADVFDLGWKDWAITMGLAFFPVVINWLNPEDKRYGVGAE